MHKFLIMLGMVFVAACASTVQEPFDPEADARIGAEVRTACTGGALSSRGGHVVEVGDRIGFVVEDGREAFLLLFSNGCSDIRLGGAAPVFKNRGDNCRRRGEFVGTVNNNFSVSGGCTIKHIYEWDEDAVEDISDAARSE